MVDGFQLYLAEHNNKLGGMDVKFIVEDDQGKPDAGVTKAKKLILQDKVHMFIGGLLASSGYALAPISTAGEDALYLVGLVGRRPHAAAAQQVSVFHADQLDLVAAAPSARSMGLRQRLQESHRHRGRLCLRLRNSRRFPVRLRSLRRQGRSRRSGRRSAPRTSGPTSRPSRRMPTASSPRWSARWRCSFPSSCAPPASRRRSSAAA